MDRLPGRCVWAAHAGRTVNLSLKDVEFLWISVPHPAPATACAGDVYRAAVELRTSTAFLKPVRMVRVSLRLVKNAQEQMDLFGEKKDPPPARPCDRIRPVR